MNEIHLFAAHFRPSISRPTVDMLCQAIDVGGEKLLWVDGLMFDHPILVPISAVGKIAYQGTFRQYMTDYMPFSAAVIDASQGQHSPAILARAVQCMVRDPSLSPEEALDLVVEEALDLIDVDNVDRGAFLAVAQSYSSVSTAS